MASAAVSDEGALRMRPTPCGCTSALLSGFTEPAFLRRRHSCRSSGSSALHHVGADAHIGPLVRIHQTSSVAVTPQLLLRRPSSSQTPSDASLCIRSAKPIARRKACALGASRNPSPRRKRQVSSVPLLVLSKLQTLRWFAIWFHLSCQKK